MLVIGLMAIIIMMIEITRVSIRMKRSFSRIIVNNTRSSLSLIVLFGAGHWLTFIQVDHAKKPTLFYIKGTFEVSFCLGTTLMKNTLGEADLTTV